MLEIHMLERERGDRLLQPRLTERPVSEHDHPGFMNTCACGCLECRRVLRDFMMAGATGETLKPGPRKSTA